MTPALEANALTKRYGRTPALSQVDLTVPAGRIAELVGPNGAGKTTLMHLAVGLLEPSSGRVQVFGSTPGRQGADTLANIGPRARVHGRPGGSELARTLRVGADVIWVTWRQHRLQLLIGTGLVAAIGALVILTGTSMRDAFARTDLPACLAQSRLDQGCLALGHFFRNEYRDVAGVLVTCVSALPVITGVFLGAPLLAREFETGTYRLAWTQSVTRTRWIVTMLAFLSIAVVKRREATCWP